MTSSNELCPALLTVRDVAAILGIGRNRAYALVNSHTIKSVKVGKQLRVPRKALQEYLDSAE